MFHSFDSSASILSTNIRSEQDLPVLKPCCSSRRVASSAFCRRCKMTEANSLNETGRRLMPLQLWQFIKSPFLKSLTIMPLLQSLGTFSKVHILVKRESQMDMQVLIEYFSISAEMLNLIPGARPIFNFFAACMISSALGGSELMSKYIKGISGTLALSQVLGLFRSFSKWEAHLSSIFSGSI